MGPAPERRIDHKPRTEDFTENWRHEPQTSITPFFNHQITKRKRGFPLFCFLGGFFPLKTGGVSDLNGIRGFRRFGGMEGFVSEIQKALDRNKKRLDFWRGKEREDGF